MAGLQLFRRWLFLLTSILISPQISAFKCGQIPVLRQGLIAGGTRSTPGMWPWHVAIYHREMVGKTSYKCGGTIINEDTVLTTFHCVAENERLIALGRLIIRAGLSDLDIFSSTTQEHRVYDIIYPPGASTSHLKDDIAALKMQTQFTYDDYVQPICIRLAYQDIEQLIGTYGTVVGWGLTEQGSTSSELREANIPVVSVDDCLESNRNAFGKVWTTKMYCAGSRSGTASCRGDSGGGMYFLMGGYWFLRGLTSFAPVDHKQAGICNSKSYVGYTDVAKYLEWMDDHCIWFEDGSLLSSTNSIKHKPDGCIQITRTWVDFDNHIGLDVKHTCSCR